ncbi:uncharacterized protein isoform X2 [Leptinotarsa decemlineata]|uniref:uncharacterized protein isoform X2 n=1 Tax=Leptinotarsa decemlineata TaxID=7539 RepID=UPI003D30C742
MDKEKQGKQLESEDKQKPSGKRSSKSSGRRNITSEDKNKKENENEELANISASVKQSIFESAKATSPKDPVKEQKKKDAVRKLRNVASKKDSITSSKIEPSVSTRIDLQYVNEGKYPGYGPRPEYILRRTKRVQKFFEKRRANTSKKFCKLRSVDVPKPSSSKKVNLKIEVPSPGASHAKVTPRRVTPTASWLYPYPQTDEELELKKPKSGIIINEKELQEKDTAGDYDSFDLVFTRTPRPVDPQTKKKKRKRGHKELEDILEDDEEVAGGRRHKGGKKQKSTKRVEGTEQDFAEVKETKDLGEKFFDDEFEESNLGQLENYLTKRFRRKLSMISQATSYQSKDFPSSEKDIAGEPEVSKYVQKFRRDSEIKKSLPKRKKIKRGTLESHSFTNINQPILKDFFFGSKEGTMHQGDFSFPTSVRNNQGICMSVAAYCYSILKHPNKWTRENIDEILNFGNNLLLESAKQAHIHRLSRELKPNELQKYCIVGEKKIRFTVDDTEVSGYINSNDKRVFNLTKALRIFFARNSAGIFKTQDISVAIWKNKYFYMFDARPRTRDLYCSPTGTAIMANFYDIPALATVFLSRSNVGNWPFNIYPLKVFRILNKDEPEKNSSSELNAISEYEVLNENKAVVSGSFDLADKCFEFSRNKQSLAMSVVCLVYSRITPPSAWHKTTVDKIMILGNKLYLECLECESIVDLQLDNLPAIFTLGPYIVEIYIYGNVLADLLYRACCCQLKCCLEEFSEKCTNALLQIGKCYLAVWKQRNMYYCFDPYSRNREGYKCRDGKACVSMHTNIDSLIETIVTNFDSKDMIFYLHAMKVCKIHRDPVQSSRFPRHLSMNDYPLEELRNYKMKKSKKVATEKPVTVDYSALAMRRLLAGESPQNSIFEIGSAVESLEMGLIPQMAQKVPSKSILKANPKIVDVIADLDSPSLTDTQVEPPLPQQPKITEEIEFMDLDSFELTMEEIELEEVAQEESYIKWGEGEEGGEEVYAKVFGEGEEEYRYEDEGLEDWFYTATKHSQYSLKEEPSRISGQVNTDITYFPIKREILYPTDLRGKQQMKYRLQKYKFTDEDWENYMPPSPPDVTKSQELKKDTNFVDLPDDTQIIIGSKNVANYGKEVEFIAPFVCIMAGVVSKKYSILSWTQDIVDYILKCGNELYGTSKFRYDQVSTLEIPRITLGTNSFRVLVQYIFDSYTRQNILELALNKILFVRSDIGVIVTPLYACAVFLKNHLYYMYDCFGNNEVGLSEGTSNEGTAYFARFKDLHSLVTRIMFNKRRRERSEEVVYSRFVLSSVKVKEIHDWNEMMKQRKTARKDKKKPATHKPLSDVEAENAEDGEVDEPERDLEYTDAEEDGEEEPKKHKKTVENEVGYKYRRGFHTIEGTTAIEGRKVLSDELKEDHFICICACLMLLTCPVARWDTKKVDQVLRNGQHVYSHAEDLEISEKRTIKNILVGKNFFDIIVKMIKIENWRNNRNLNKGIDTLIGKKLSYFLVQFPNACYVVHKTQNEIFHLFDPYGVQRSAKAGWVRCKSLKQLKFRLKKLIISGGESYRFYNFEVTSIQKAPKEVLLSYRLQQYDTEMVPKKEYLGKPFYEEVEWLEVDPIPWSRKIGQSAVGKTRGTVDNLWHNWDEEYPKDLFSLMGNIHQYSERFSRETRGKQTLANLVTAIGMMEIYDLAEWNSAVVDSVLVNGDNYFVECIQDISDEDYEISMDDLKPDCSIFPFAFNVTFTPVVEGTMFLVRVTQFNLFKALSNVVRRCGIISCTKSERKRHVAFGKLQESEYFMFDSDCQGSPMFLGGYGVAYILRMTTLNRLLHVLTLTLRGGDFFIYEVEITNLKPIS